MYGIMLSAEHKSQENPQVQVQDHQLGAGKSSRSQIEILRDLACRILYIMQI